MNALTETQKAYLAGLLDGEGCVGIQKKRSSSKRHEYDFDTRVIITNSNYSAICWIKEVTGLGCAYQYKRSSNIKWNVVHRWVVVSRNAREFLNAIYPYLIIKKEITDLCLTFPFNNHKHRSDERYEEQIAYFQTVKDKNKRGVK